MRKERECIQRAKEARDLEGDETLHREVTEMKSDRLKLQCFEIVSVPHGQ